MLGLQLGVDLVEEGEELGALLGGCFRQAGHVAVWDDEGVAGGDRVGVAEGAGKGGGLG